MSVPPLDQSLSHVAALLERARPGFAAPMALAAGGDPYFIDLPAYQGGVGGMVTPQALQVLASLYFLAEVEGTYLMPVAEELAAARFTLRLSDHAAAERLEALAEAMRHGWVERGLRNQIFARVFGIGYVDPNLGDTAVNHEFEPRFARFCLALAGAARDLQGWGAPAGAAMRAAVAAQSLLGNLGPRVQGNTLIVTERLAGQLRMSIQVLNHPGLTVLFQGRSLWDVIRSVLGSDVPNMQDHVNRAQTGLRLMSWMSAHLVGLGAADAQAIIDAVSAESALQGWADIWLEAAGAAPVSTPVHQGRTLQ